jgi:hypothetical protein
MVNMHSPAHFIREHLVAAFEVDSRDVALALGCGPESGLVQHVAVAQAGRPEEGSEDGDCVLDGAVALDVVKLEIE